MLEAGQSVSKASVAGSLLAAVRLNLWGLGATLLGLQARAAPPAGLRRPGRLQAVLERGVAQRRARSHRGPGPGPVQRRGQGRHAESLVLSLASIGQVHTSLGGAVTWLVAIRAWVRRLVCELEAAVRAGERGYAGRQDAADLDE